METIRASHNGIFFCSGTKSAKVSTFFEHSRHATIIFSKDSVSEFEGKAESPKEKNRASFKFHIGSIWLSASCAAKALESITS